MKSPLCVSIRARLAALQQNSGNLNALHLLEAFHDELDLETTRALLRVVFAPSVSLMQPAAISERMSAACRAKGLKSAAKRWPAGYVRRWPKKKPRGDNGGAR